MGKVTYSPGIEYVNGALAKAKKKDGHRCGDYLIGTHRTAATQNPDCTRLYIRKGTSYERTSPLTSNELDARARFTAVAAAVKARKSDLNKITTDQQNFAAQKGPTELRGTEGSSQWQKDHEGVPLESLWR